MNLRTGVRGTRPDALERARDAWCNIIGTTIGTVRVGTIRRMTDADPGISTRGARQAKHVERAIIAYRMRYVDGKQLHEIAAELGVTPTHAKRLAVKGAEYCVSQDLRDEAMTASLAELDALRARAYEFLNADYVLVQFGKVATDEDGNALRDVMPNLAAMDRLLKIEQRRAAIFGYEAPRKSTVTVITEDLITQEINRLSAELAAVEAEQAAADLAAAEQRQIDDQ